MKTYKFTNNIWEDLETLSVGKMDYRAEYQDNKRKVIDLNGKWDFKYLESPLISDEEFYSATFTPNSWDKINVPGCWEMEGFGKPSYENARYHMGFKPPYIISDNPTGLYIKNIKVEKLEDKKYILRMRGVDSACQIWVNGEYVGYNKHARVTGEFEISKFLKSGENKIALKVFQFTDQSYIEDPDMWVLAGIFREVELLEESAVGVKDYQIHQNFSDNLKSVELSVDFKLEGKLNKESTIILKDPQGKTVVEKHIEIKDGNIVVGTIDSPSLWSAETPNLYTLEIINDYQHIEEKIGFRKIEIKGKVFYANGVAIKLKGVNRHDFSPTGGRVVTYEQMLDDIKIMKSHNINAIRTSHYPSKYDLYKLCDEYGIWVMEEADLETHGATCAGNWGFMAHDPKWEKHHVEKGKQMVERTKNRPCIFSYSLGNEAGMGPNFVKMAQYIKDKNTNTILHYEGDVDCIVSEINSSMYTWVEKENVFRNEYRCFDDWKNGIQRGTKNDKWKNMPHLECEYAHAMGNSPGGLKDFWDLWYSDERYMGGFVWEWYDHGIKTEESDDYLYGGDFGELKHDSNFCIDGLLFPNRKPSPGLTELKEVYSPLLMEIKDDNLHITNRYHFLKPNEQVKLVFSEIEESGKVVSIVQLDIPTLKYLESTTIELPKLSNDFSIIKVEAQQINNNHTVGSTSAYNNINKINSKVNASNAMLADERDAWVLENGSIKLTTSKIDGSISIYQDNKKIMGNANKFSMWRPPIDNDKRSGYFQRWVDFAIRAIHSVVREVNFQDNQLTVKLVIGTPSMGWGYDIEHTYSIDKNQVNVKTKAKPYRSIIFSDKPQWKEGGVKGMVNKDDFFPIFLPKLGFRFELPKDMNNVEYIGKGPGENYSDSSQANALGFYKTTVDGLWTNYVYPQGNGNRMHVSKLVMNNKKNAISFISGNTFNFSASKFSDLNIENAEHPSDLSADDVIYLNIDYKQSGLGSGACGQTQLMKDMCKMEEFAMEYNIIID